MNTVDDYTDKRTAPTVRLKPKRAELSPAFSRPVPVKTPEGGTLEPTIQMSDREYYELDLSQLPDEDVSKIAKLYSGDRIPRKLNEAFALCGIFLVPATWVSRGVA